MTHRQKPTPLAYRVNDAASALGISRRTVYRLIDSGKLRATKAGSITLIPAADVLAVVAGAA